VNRSQEQRAIVVERVDLPPADFHEAAQSQSFREAVVDFEKHSGGERVPVEGLPGAEGFRIETKHVDRNLLAWNQEYRNRGAYVFRYDNAYGYARDAVILLPTTDQWTVLDAAATDGVNYGLSHADVVRKLRNLNRTHAFVLTEAGLDYVAGRFVRPIGDSEALAQRLYRLCPDIVDQGPETVEALARELDKSQELFCWWD
jgi:hypothetical protein